MKKKRSKGRRKYYNKIIKHSTPGKESSFESRRKAHLKENKKNERKVEEKKRRNSKKSSENLRTLSSVRGRYATYSGDEREMGKRKKKREQNFGEYQGEKG